MNQGDIDQLGRQPVARGQLLIAGIWGPGQDAPLPVLSPIDGVQIATIESASAADVARATAAARRAFDDGRWSRQSPGQRRAVLLRDRKSVV